MSLRGVVRHLYVHVPFCASRCGYCAFVVDTESLDRRDAYVSALLAELSLEADALAPLETVYIGGGTPTMLDDAQLARLLGGIGSLLGPDAEVTIEANPETVTRKRADALVAAGVTRMSLGVQSFHAPLLRALDRRATADDSARAVAAARAAGIRSLSIDLLFAVPGQTLDQVRGDLAAALALAPDHISWYELELKPGSALAATPGIAIDEAFAEDAYAHIVEELERAGYRWYELANFALGGHRCRHSLAYWHGRDYVGIGVGAVGTRDGARWRNRAGIERYVEALDAGRRPPSSVETIDADTRRRERWMLGLRLDEPLSITSAGDPDNPAALAHLAEIGLLRADGDTVALTRRGRFLQNAVVGELMDYA